ncbi:MAG: hypothetical protein V3U16_05600 [Candidatus Neomarinimicrobiota bacterium]
MVHNDRASRKRYLLSSIICTIILTTLLFISCKTAYGPKGISGGYFESKISDSEYQVSFKGNQHTTLDMTNASLLYRCADLTLEKGYEYFTIIDDNIDTTTLTLRPDPVVPGKTVSSMSGGTRTVIMADLGNPTASTNYTATSHIKMYKSDALDYSMLLYYAPQVKEAFSYVIKD